MLIQDIQEVRWKGSSSLETLSIINGPGSIEVKSKMDGHWQQYEYSVEYSLSLSSEWEIKELILNSSLLPDSCVFLRSIDGYWFDEHFEELHHLHGCRDIDISVTPMTNTLPIRRLGKRLSRPTSIEVVFVDGLFGTLDRVSQEYHQLNQGLFRYKNHSSGFITELYVDQEGLIIEYPGHYYRI